MGTRKLVADSSANVTIWQGTPFAAAPLKIITNETEFVDDAALDVQAMVRFFDSYRERSKTSCPNTADWLAAFDSAEEVFCVTITSGLSGSYNAACVARDVYESENPGKRVYVVDSLSAGPELVLLLEKLDELMGQALPFEEICQKIEEYKQNTGLLFMLASLKNFAANGRVSPAVAKMAGFLNIRVVGKASDQGTLEPMNKCRGLAKSLDKLMEHLKTAGLQTGKVRIAHCENEPAAQKLKEMILQAAPGADVQIAECRGLCSYYAEKGGLLIGFEKN